MKLLMISGDRGLAVGKRGAFWYTLEELHTHFDRIDILCPHVPNTAPSLHPFPNVSLHPSPWSLWKQPLWVRSQGTSLHRAIHFDVMTAHEYPPFYNGIGARLLSRALGIPYALEIHHIVGWPIASSLAERIGSVLSRLFLSWDARPATAVRTVNRTVTDTLVSWGVPASKIAVVPSLYIDLDRFKREPETPKRYDLVSAGRLVANKGFFELLDALVRIPSASLLLIGDGPDRASLEKHAQSIGIADRVTFLGWLPSQQEVIAHMRSARVFVMNSRSEGGPRTAVEALALGLPVVSTRVGVMPEVIRDGENGFLIPFDTTALARTLQQLLAQETTLARLSSHAASSVSRFERKSAVAAYASFLSSLAQHRS